MTRANVVERPGASAGLALLSFKTLSCYGFAAVFAISLGACGGGGGGSEVAADTQGAASEPIEPATMDIAQAKPERLDASATGEPKSLLMKRSGNGDVFVVWYADNPERRNLWASRYDAATRKWGKAELIEVTDVQVGDFNLATDGRGNAFVLYQAGDQIAVVRYNAAAKSWSPTTSTYYLGTGTNIGGIAADSAGSAMVVFTGGKFSIFEISARYYDVTKGGWQPQVLAEQNFSGTGFSDSPIVVLNKNGDGNALWRYRRTGFSSIGGNSFTASTKQWDQIQDGGISVLGGIPGSGVCGGVGSLQLSADATGNFFVASMTSVQAPLFDITTQINVSFFSGSKREWLGTQTLVPANPANDLKLQRALTDMAGNAVVLWTQTEGDRTGLRSASYDIATKSWRPSQVVDDKLGGGADLVDFDFDECGGASAVWLQYEAGRPQEGAIVNVASNRYRTKDDRWFNAKLLEKQAGQVRSPKVALLPDGKGFAAWIQEEGGVFRVNVGRLN